MHTTDHRTLGAEHRASAVVYTAAALALLVVGAVVFGTARVSDRVRPIVFPVVSLFATVAKATLDATSRAQGQRQAQR